jgi:ribosomal protein L37AE/L43A
VNGYVDTLKRLIRIEHCVHHEFALRFMRDLAVCRGSTILLSPFVAGKRSATYCDVFGRLVRSGVPVRIFVRPIHEQPEGLKTGYLAAIRALEATGVDVESRAGMHEKIAMIDEKILWHGSLNILSHNNTKESMLRIESAELVSVVMDELGLRSGASAADNRALAQGADLGPLCPICGSGMQLFENSGIWVCHNAPKCNGIISVGASSLEEEAGRVHQLNAIELICPLCGQCLTLAGHIFKVVRCVSPQCDFALSPRLTTWLLRIAGRKLKT